MAKRNPDETPEGTPKKKAGPARRKANKKAASKAAPKKKAAAKEPKEEPVEVKAEAFEGGSGGRTVEMPGPGDRTPPPEGSSNAWSMACHLGGLADFGVAIFGIGILVPLAIWLARKDTDDDVDHHGKEALNFQLNVLMWWLISLLLCCVLIGLPMLALLPIIEVVLVIVAAVNAANGERFRYPGIIRFVQ